MLSCESVELGSMRTCCVRFSALLYQVCAIFIKPLHRFNNVHIDIRHSNLTAQNNTVPLDFCKKEHESKWKLAIKQTGNNLDEMPSVCELISKAKNAVKVSSYSLKDLPKEKRFFI